MNTDKKNSLWSTEQRQALAVLGIPLWQAKHVHNVPSETGSQEQDEKLFCYKVEQWLFVSSEQLAVEMPQWLNDIVRACTGDNRVRLAEVSRSTMDEWQGARVITLPTAAPSVLEKRALWKRIVNAQQ